MIWAQMLIVYWLAFGLMLAFGRRSLFIALVIALLAMAPLHENISAAMALRGLWGDPSITSMLLMVLSLFGKLPSALRFDWRLPALAALLGILLYASALGPWNIDLYRFGYQPVWLVAVLGAIALIAWGRGQAIYLWLLGIDLLAWQANWLESTNLWDALFDPLLIIVMLVLALRNGYRARQHRKILLA
jgi:hypothetical protein